MKLPRNTRIFRGQLDVAPVASVFFMTAILLFLHSSVVFTPGVRLDLKPIMGTNAPSVYIDSEGLIHYHEALINETAFERRLRDEAREGRAPKSFVLQVEGGAPTNALEVVRKVSGELGIPIEPHAARIELPTAARHAGTTGASLIVAVNMSGQYFFENQLVAATNLPARLKAAAAASREPLTLELRLDKAVAVETVVNLSEIAREAGFAHVLLATRPPLTPAKPSE